MSAIFVSKSEQPVTLRIPKTYKYSYTYKVKNIKNIGLAIQAVAVICGVQADRNILPTISIL